MSVEGNHNGHTPDQLIDPRIPLDFIEPEIARFDEVRDARVQCVRLLNSFANCIERALTGSHVTVRDVSVAFWGAAYGLGLNCADGITMTERAAQLGVERAAISKRARNFVSANALSPSWHMRQESAVDAYTQARVAEVERSAVHGNGHAATG